MTLDRGLRFQIEAVEHRRARVGEKHVSLGQEIFELSSVVFFSEIKHNAALAPIVQRKGRVRKVLPNTE
jgi:hypothetical protein